MNSEQEKAITAQRTSDWFATFVASTDEKKATADALAQFFMNLRSTHLIPHLFHRHEPVVIDIGTGTGHLSSEIKQLFEQMNPEGVNYNGIEYDPAFAAKSQKKLKGGTVMPSDGFSGAESIKQILQLEEQPDLIIGSHSFMYSPDLAKTTDSVKDLLTPRSIGLFINLSPKTDQISLTKGFAECVGGETAEQLAKNFDRLRMPHHAIHFRAHMNFPTINDDLWKELSEAKPYDETNNPHEAHKDGLVVRKMAEFVLQRPLEALNQEQRDKYLDGLRKKLRVQNNNLYLDNIIEVTAAPDADRATRRALELASESTNRDLSALQR